MIPKKITTTLTVCLVCLLFTSASHAQFFDNDEDKWKRLFIELKKVNVRLADMESVQVKKLQDTQAQLLSQIETVKSLIPNLQGSIEQIEARLDNRLGKTDAKVAALGVDLKDQLAKVDTQTETLKEQMSKVETQSADLASKVTFELQENVRVQKEIMAEQKTQFQDQLTQFKDGMAADMERFNQANKESFQTLSADNAGTLGKVVEALDGQKTAMDEMKAVLQTDVVNAINEQYTKDRESLIAEIHTIDEKNSASRSAHQQALLDSFKTIDDNFKTINDHNQGLVAILGKSIKAGDASGKRLDALDVTLKEINGNLDVNRQLVEKLKDIFDAKLQPLSDGQATSEQLLNVNGQKVDLVKENLLVAENKINKLAESIKTLQTQNSGLGTSVVALTENLGQVQSFQKVNEEGFNKLIDSYKTIASASSKLETKIDQANQTVFANQSNLQITDEKLNRLIDIMQNIGNHMTSGSKKLEEKVDLSLQRLESDESNGRVIDEKINRIVDILQTLLANSSVFDQKLARSFEKLEPQLANIDLANQKVSQMINVLGTVAEKIDTQGASNDNTQQLAKLIDIMKSMAQDQERVNRAVASQAEQINQVVANQAEQINQVVASQAAQVNAVAKDQAQIAQMINLMAKDQAEIRDRIAAGPAQPNEGLSNQVNAVAEDQLKLTELINLIVKDQTEIKDRLADLRRKANVNIARNDDIKKKLETIGKP